MNEDVIKMYCKNSIPENYLNNALDCRKTRENKIRLLLEKKKIPDSGWDDALIEEFINYLSSLDSNNFSNKCGVGEREARIACNLVAKRHYYFGHGIGRSGDLQEAQPKAAGSSLMSQLANALVLDLIHTVGIRSIKQCFLIPMATGMSICLCFLTLKKIRPNAKYVLWSRIDQKSCFKSITTSGLLPVTIKSIPTEKGMETDTPEFERQIEILGADNILCIFSTTSCFAPRLCDKIIELAKLARKTNIPHIVNNAYGLQSTFLTHQIEQASKVGNVDLFVQSTDKNLMVPVGGAIISGFNQKLVSEVSKTYAGRASSSQTLDVLITVLSLGKEGYMKLIRERKENFEYLRDRLKATATEFNELVLDTKANPISLAFTLNSTIQRDNLTKLGSMLFTRGVSGARVISTDDTKTIDGHEFKGWGSHSDDSKIPYLTVAAALGITKSEVDIFIEKLRKCIQKIIKPNKS